MIQNNTIKIFSRFVCLFAILILSACSRNNSNKVNYNQCQSISFPATLKNQIISKLSTYPNIPGAVVAVYHPSVGYSIASFGLSNKFPSTPMPVDAVFDVGSVMKLINWIALEKAFEEGKVSYSNLISQYIPELATVLPGNPTVQNLTQHSTGLIDIPPSALTDLLTNLGDPVPYTYTFSEAVGFLQNEDTNGFTNGIKDGFNVGAHWNYSTWGARIGAEIVMRSENKDIKEIVRTKIFSPLGLKSTYHMGFVDLPTKLAQGYGNDQGDPNEPQEFWELSQYQTASSLFGGNIWSSACDLLNFSTAISQPEREFLKPETILNRTQSLLLIGGGQPNNTIYQGRGVMKYSLFNTGDFWIHAGAGLSSHSSVTGYHESKKLAITILTNLDPDFIQNDYGLHFEVMKIIDDFFI
jgi:CubicO group peptidase (beta-lactamase class C family)